MGRVHLILAQLRADDRTGLRRLKQALLANGGSLSAAAAELGVSARQLSRVGKLSTATGEVLRRYGMGRRGAARMATATRLAKLNT